MARLTVSECFSALLRLVYIENHVASVAANEHHASPVNLPALNALAHRFNIINSCADPINFLNCWMASIVKAAP